MMIAGSSAPGRQGAEHPARRADARAGLGRVGPLIANYLQGVARQGFQRIATQMATLEP